jgi:catechol 2,3-dioxygenase-like lactoylglutathione lyase family enzyme
MNQNGGGFVIATSDLDKSIEFYCQMMQLHVVTTDGTSAMLAPEDGQPNQPWLIALRPTGRSPVHGGRNALGIRALFFRVDLGDLDGLERRLRDLEGFHERHVGEFYEMVSAYDPDHTAIGFWASLSDAPVIEPSFVPPSVYNLD